MTLYRSVLQILAREMGPAAEDFLALQCEERLEKSTDALTPADLPVIAQLIEEEVGPILGSPLATRLGQQIRGLRV